MLFAPKNPSMTIGSTVPSREVCVRTLKVEGSPGGKLTVVAGWIVIIVVLVAIFSLVRFVELVRPVLPTELINSTSQISPLSLVAFGDDGRHRSTQVKIQSIQLLT